MFYICFINHVNLNYGLFLSDKKASVTKNYAFDFEGCTIKLLPKVLRTLYSWLHVREPLNIKLGAFGAFAEDFCTSNSDQC